MEKLLRNDGLIDMVFRKSEIDCNLKYKTGEKSFLYLSLTPCEYSS